VIDEVVTAHVRAKLSAYGLELDGAGVKDIVLPGEMKTILAQVVEAGKAAEANGIRRREETAATRSLLNTAKVMENNPTALRLKELESLERVAERIDKISVFGGLDQVLNGLVKLR
jgi:regulator of protease activity HflC (stomatin/prohibitin superfamily)